MELLDEKLMEGELPHKKKTQAVTTLIPFIH